MKMYLPLSIDGDSLKAEPSELDLNAWQDESFVEFFDTAVAETHQVQKRTVAIGGVEYSECEVLVPISSVQDRSFVAVNEDLLPIGRGRLSDPEPGTDGPKEEWLTHWLERTSESEKYYFDYSVDLSTKYISPRVSWDDGSETNILHPDSIRRSSRVLIVGQPGAGKTSLLRHITQRYTSKLRHRKDSSATPTVFYFQLRDFAHKSKDLDKYLQGEEDRVGSTHVAHQRSLGQVVYLFDGLDELNSGDRRGFADWLSSLNTNRSSMSIIVTSRELDTLNSGIWRTFKRAKIEPFARPQISEYCHLVLQKRELADSFLDVIDDNPDLQQFLRNPLSLSLALGMYMLRGVLPFNIGSLCKEVVLQSIERWDAHRGINRRTFMSAESMSVTLGRLAFKLQAAGLVQFQPSDMSDILPFELEKFGAERALQELKECTGLVSELQGGSFAFSHRYFQDFFCANHLVERASGLSSELSEHGRDASWVDVWRQVGQLCGDPTFFAEDKNRIASSSIQTIDRLVSALLAHHSLSRSEIERIVIGLADEISARRSGRPSVADTDFGATLSFDSSNPSDLNTLAHTIVNLFYLKGSHVADSLVEFLSQREQDSFSRVLVGVLTNRKKPRPKIGVSSLDVYF